MSKEQRSNYEGQEHESLRRGHEVATKEKVVDAKEDKACHAAAKQSRFDATGEVSAAPRFEDARK